jgi:integrase
MCAVFERAMPHLGASGFPELLADYAAQRFGGPYLLAWGGTQPATTREARVHSLPEGASDPQLLNRIMCRRCAKVGIERLTPHQLRHTAATNLLRCGVPLHIAQRLMNHSLVVRRSNDEVARPRAGLNNERRVAATR